MSGEGAERELIRLLARLVLGSPESTASPSGPSIVDNSSTVVNIGSILVGGGTSEASSSSPPAAPEPPPLSELEQRESELGDKDCRFYAVWLVPGNETAAGVW